MAELCVHILCTYYLQDESLLDEMPGSASPSTQSIFTTLGVRAIKWQKRKNLSLPEITTTFGSYIHISHSEQ
jgi:hypothetical protein